MYDSNDSIEGNWLNKRTLPSKQNATGCANERSRCATFLVVVASIFDVVIVFGVAAIEYFFRWTTLLPVRNRNIRCTDINVTQDSLIDPNKEFNEFPFSAQIPEITVYIYSFSVPIIAVIIGELLLFSIANQSAKLLPSGSCSPLHIPHTIRRLYRFSLTFLFGMLSLMVIIDTIKTVVGDLRPTFANLCQLLPCNNLSDYVTISTKNIALVCGQTSDLVIKKARTSCPSMRSAISMYAAVFVSIYLHGIGSIHHCKFLLLPAINMVLFLASVFCGIQLVNYRENHFRDVFIGHVIGGGVGFYLGEIVLRRFKFQETVSNRRILRQIALLQSGVRSKEGREIQTSTDSCLEPVRLRRNHVTYPCNCATSPFLPVVSKPDEPSTFFPANKANRKSVTLPISSPHVPTTSTSSENKSNEIQINDAHILNRYSVINLPSSRRQLVLRQNIPQISQELMTLLNERKESRPKPRELIDLQTNEMVDHVTKC